MKKHLILLFSVAMLAVCGCGKDDGTDPSVDPNAVSGEWQTIKFPEPAWVSGGYMGDYNCEITEIFYNEKDKKIRLPLPADGLKSYKNLNRDYVIFSFEYGEDFYVSFNEQFFVDGILNCTNNIYQWEGSYPDFVKVPKTTNFFINYMKNYISEWNKYPEDYGLNISFESTWKRE